MSIVKISYPQSGTLVRRQVFIQSPMEATMERLGIDYETLWKMDEREAFQRMRRVRLGRETPTYANLGRYYEPFEEVVAPISAQALESAFPPILRNWPAPAPFEDEVPMGSPASLPPLLEIEEDVIPVRATVHLPQIICPTPITPRPTLEYPAIPTSPAGVTTTSPLDPVVTQIGSPYVEDLDSIDGDEETGESTESTESSEDEYIYAESTNENRARGPSNRRGQKSSRRRREEAAPYSLEGNASTRTHKRRSIASKVDFPHPSIPNPRSAREQADYNAGKLKWWSQRVLRPLLSASPQPLSKDAILSIIKTDLGLKGKAWRAFHDEYLNPISQSLTAGAKVGISKGAVFVRLKHTNQVGGRWWSIARVEGRSEAEIKADTGGWVPCTPTQAIRRARRQVVGV